MRFANPQLLHLFWFLPLLWLMLVLLLKRRRQKAGAFVAQGLLDKVAVDFSLTRLRSKNIFFLLSCVFLILALARPQWGFVMEKVRQEGLDILLAVDVSKSMMTQDVRPSRLERSKLAIKDLLKKIDGDRVGLMAFAGEAFVLCPLTVDYAGFAMSLDAMDMGSIPRGGTNIARTIKEAIKTFGQKDLKYKALIILTDGEEEEGDALAAAAQAKQLGVRIFTVGIGTKEGDLIQIAREDGSREFLKDAQGNFVKSRLNEELLQRIAYETSGAYVRSGGAEFGLEYLYTKELSRWAKRGLDERIEKRFYERYQWPLFLGAICMVLGI